MFLRKLYLNLIKILNHKLVLKYLNLFKFENLSIPGSDIRNLDIFKKIYLCVLPNVHSKHYNLLNENTVRLMNLRKMFLPNFSYRLESYISYDYDLLDVEFFIDFFDFIKEDVTEDWTDFNRIFKSKNDFFSFFLMFFFLKKHFYFYFSKNFFKEFDDDNLTKVFFFFIKFFFNTNFDLLSKLYIKNLYKYTNWFNHIGVLKNINFAKLNSFENLSEDANSDLSNKSVLNDFQSKVIASIKDDIKPYVILYSKACWTYFDRATFKLIGTVFRVRIDLNNLFDVLVNSEFFKKINSYYPYRYNSSSVNKFINLSKLDDFIFFYLRKNKIFNKGRYSRNRQTYRTGFYWCLWLNIFVVYGLHFVFYRFTFTFGYLWLFLFVFFASFIFSRALKFNLISWNSIILELSEFRNFVKFFFLNIFVFLKKTLQILSNFIKKIINDDATLSKVEFSEDDFNIEFNSLNNDQILVEFFNKFEFLIFENLEEDMNLILGEDQITKLIKSRSATATSSILPPQSMFLSDAHDICSELLEQELIKRHNERMAKFQIRWTKKFKI